MTELRLEVDNHPVPSDITDLEDRIHEFNYDVTGVRDGDELMVSLRDEAGAIVGGLYGWTWAGLLEIRYLWVEGSRRGQGHGKKLVEAAEEEAVRRGVRKVLLDTYDFQARGFYVKLGFQVFGTLADCPPGHARYFLWKSL